MHDHSCVIPINQPAVIEWKCPECGDVWRHYDVRAPGGMTPGHWARVAPQPAWLDVAARRFLGGVGYVVILRCHENGWPHVRFEVSPADSAGPAAGGVCEADELREALAPWLRRTP